MEIMSGSIMEMDWGRCDQKKMEQVLKKWENMTPEMSRCYIKGNSDWIFDVLLTENSIDKYKSNSTD